ncbi:transmembrane and coiled-coil domains protein 1-like isoform X2 [Heterodontus francisci]|uniref:transmembrane and coiled-coil domains protein 1-like isoform X2 n=1 Tax=Heterodontus francisci TaxID=7792 RepID=UPI00355B9A8D
MVHRLSLRRRHQNVKAELSDVASSLPSASPLNRSSEGSPNVPSRDLQELAVVQRLKSEQLLLQRKVLKIAEQIRVQQTSRNANVSEYLRLISSTDRTQAFRLKQAFERKNQYLASIIAQLQRKLQHYVNKQQQLDTEVNLLQAKDPPPFAIQQLQTIRKNSLDYGPELSSLILSESTLSRSHLLPTQLEAQAADLSAFNTMQQEASQQPGIIDDQYSVITTYSEELQDLIGLNFEDPTTRINWLEQQNMGYLSVLEELTDIKETQLNLELNFKNIAEQYNQDYTVFEESLQEEKYRTNQLQAQLNDLIDLHQNEVLNLKSELASLEEKIAYQSYESSRDIWEVLENFQTKMTRLEQQQQMAQGEILDHVNTRKLLGKMMNLLLIVFAVVLMLMSTISALVLPFIKTRARTITTGAVIFLLIAMWQNWEFFSVFSARRMFYRWR